MQKKGAIFLSCDLKDFFLTSPMDRPEYVKVPIRYFLDNSIARHNLNKLIHSSGNAYVIIKKGMHGLKHATILTY